jgi:hypothetical protein
MPIKLLLRYLFIILILPLTVFAADIETPPDMISIQNVPDGATVSVDTSHHRFVIDNILSPKKLEFVYLTTTYGSVVFVTNDVTIPSIL